MEIKGKFTLKKNREDAVLRFHPWIFSGAIDKVEGKPVDGDIVEIYSSKGEYLATGYALPGSISVKIFWFGPDKPKKSIWVDKISAAYNRRKSLGFTDDAQNNSYRLVFSEGDGLPGLIIDMYNGIAVIQAHSTGMYLLRNELSEALKKVFGEKLLAVYDKSAEALGKSGSESSGDTFLLGNSETVEILENGNLFQVDFASGQKTGFYLDQRDNRALLAHYAKGRNVLNTFCYTGGFSVYALKGGAKKVTSVDSSKRAIELLEKNIEINKFSGEKHSAVVADAKQFLADMHENYDLIVLDPPAFAKRHTDRQKGMKGYTYINSAALRKIKPGGLFFTFSCSQAISREQFTSIVTAAALEANRNVRILHHLGHPADHPVSLFHPEGEYLKGLVLQVD
jgi:23S rRNA (cytosine1962-C5)-methyltransferase